MALASQAPAGLTAAELGQRLRAWKNLSLLNTKADVFDSLRQAFHRTPETDHSGLNHDGEEVPLGVLETQVRAWRQQLLARTQDAATPAFTPMLAQLDPYWPKLFAPPLIVDTAIAASPPHARTESMP